MTVGWQVHEKHPQGAQGGGVLDQKLPYNRRRRPVELAAELRIAIEITEHGVAPGVLCVDVDREEIGIHGARNRGSDGGRHGLELRVDGDHELEVRAVHMVSHNQALVVERGHRLGV